ncbi:MAG: rod-binding protein [Pseudomonadota bacterium]
MKLENNVIASMDAKPATQAGDAQQRLAKLKKTCSEFESVFIQNLMASMRKTVVKSGLLPESPGSETYESMFDQQIATFLSKGRGVGLGQAMFNQLARRQDLEDVARESGASDVVYYRKIISPDHAPDKWRLDGAGTNGNDEKEVPSNE